MFRRLRSVRFLTSAAVFTVLALSAGGCATFGSGDITGALPGATSAAAAPHSEAEWRRDAEVWGERYRADQGDPVAAVRYARALSANGQRSQAVSVLEQASLRNPKNSEVLGAYGRALSEAGRYEQALEVLGRAHSPDQPDWHLLSAQGTVLDQLGRHQEAQNYYASALKIVPGEPTVLSNLGLSYALAKDLRRAEETLRQAATRAPNDPRVRQNLALVIGLQGRFGDAEEIARADLPAAEAAANVGYLREMLAQKDDWKRMGRPSPIAAMGKN